MKTVEIITVRMDPQREEPLLRDLRAALAAKSPSDDRVNVELYRRAMVQTDLSIHLRSDSPRMDVLPSVLGRRLAYALRDFGPINHSAWYEEVKQ